MVAPFLPSEPMGRIELPTYSLPWSCSTPELHRRVRSRAESEAIMLDFRTSRMQTFRVFEETFAEATVLSLLGERDFCRVRHFALFFKLGLAS